MTPPLIKYKSKTPTLTIKIQGKKAWYSRKVLVPNEIYKKKTFKKE